jgi:ABC-type branched-subunit amino acid transport system ATPase component
MLSCLQLKKYFGGVRAVDGCTFEVKANTITALIGPNGSGKSTVFNLIAGILRADSGTIVFDGRPITNLSPNVISNLGISRLFQQSRLFNNLTVKTNLLMALDNEDEKFWKNFFGFNKITSDKEERVREILRLVKMENFEHQLASELSFGQRRLVEISRAILNPHKFLMLDEPVAGVTPQLREEISKLLRSLKQQGETILLIEHDMNFTLNIADYIIVLDEGKVIAEGSPDEIRHNPKVLEAYLGEEEQ